MAELKTKKNTASVSAFLKGVEDPTRRKDCETVRKIMREETGSRAAMWGDAIVGFGSYHYKYASGREGDWMLCGFSPRKQNLSVYIMAGFTKYEALLNKLGKHKTGKSCLYIKRLDDIDLAVLRELIRQSIAHLRNGATPGC